MTLQLPNPAQRLVVGDRIDVEWYRKLQALVDRVNAGDTDTVDAEAEIAAIATSLGSPDGTVANIPAIEQIDLSAITITGTNIVSVTGSLATGLVEIGGTPLEDSGVGALLGITRDSFGRVSGTTDATITGTADRIDVADGDAVAGPPTIDIAATYAGQTSITTLGTIATGVWNATAIPLTHGGTGADYSTVVANTVWAGPTTGADAAPAFRTLVAADIPDLSGTYQPLDATLTAFAALTIAADSLTIGTGADAFSQTTFAANTFPAKASTGSLVAKSITDFGLSLVDDADASAARTTLGLVIGTNVQAYDADLTTWAGLTPSANAQSLVTAADYAAMRGLLDLEAGTDFYSIAGADAAFQPLDGELTALAGLTSAADALPYFTGAGTATTTTLTSYARTLLDDTDAVTARSTLGLTIGTNVQAWDSTLDTVAAWALTGTANSTTFLSGDGTFRNNLTGPLGIGSSSLSNVNLRMSLALGGAISTYAMYADAQIQSIATTLGAYFYSRASTQAAAFTCAAIRHFTAEQGTFGAGSTVTNQYGYTATSSLVGGVNNFGFFSDIASGSGRWGFRGAGTADNAYAGNSKFGATTAPAAKVDIAAGSATAGTAPLKFTSGTVLSAAVAGVMEYDGDPHFTKSDATRRYIPLAPNATKTTAGAPYANDGYITIHINGTDFKVMTTT